MPDVNYNSLDYEFGTFVGSWALFGYAIDSAFGKTANSCENRTGNPIEGSNAYSNPNALKQQLSFKETTSIFEKNGTLKQEIVSKSSKIIDGKNLKNQTLVENLQKTGGNINDWGKYESASFQSPTGKFKVHFYYNKVTKATYFDADYKSVFNHQGNW